MITMFDKPVVLPCEACGVRPATQKHHKYPQRRGHVRKYGRVLIDDRRNIQYVCAECGSSHAGQGRGLIVWNERDYQEALQLSE
jgi:hypothetical protein